MKMKNSLGDRMKQYEGVTRYFLPRRTYTLIRVDGKAFHTYTKRLERPYDVKLMNDMDATAIYVCENLQGCKLGFVQSDEMSFLLTDFDDIATQACFDANVQKLCSISASFATAKFNQLNGEMTDILAAFDSRVWTIPQRVEVENYFLWRQKDSTRNSISAAAQYFFSHKQLKGKSSNEMQEMLFTEKDINWNDYPIGFKRGRVILKEQYEKEGAIRNRWISVEPPIFTEDREFLSNLIP